MEQIIVAQNLTKKFVSFIPCKGPIHHQIKNYFFPRTKLVTAVNEVNFSINKGERVAFIGPNGAGKSTTIKMLTGILQPTSGNIEILRKNPIKERSVLAYDITAIFGHSSKLWYHLPVEDSLYLLSTIYEIPIATYKKRLINLVTKFDISFLLKKLVRQLSLGERIRCEIVASLLHNPKVIFLDEPTIGLDINAKCIIRDLLRSLSQEEETTLLLTSHDTKDIELICDRVIIINKGAIVFNDTLTELKKNYRGEKIIHVSIREKLINSLPKGLEILESNPYHLRIKIDTKIIPSEQAINTFLKRYKVQNFLIENPSLEDIIKTFYEEQIYNKL